MYLCTLKANALGHAREWLKLSTVTVPRASRLSPIIIGRDFGKDRVSSTVYKMSQELFRDEMIGTISEKFLGVLQMISSA